MKDDRAGEITRILARIGKDDDPAAAALLPLVYDELHALAIRYFRLETPAHTLQPTALVHEAFVKLTGAAELHWKDRAHFFAIAARAMRRVLTDHARRRKAAKRGGKAQRLTLSGLVTPATKEAEIDLVAIEDALAGLAERAPRQARIVELRFLAGLTERETAHVLETPLRTVQRDWRAARAFLRCELSGDCLS